MTAKEFLREKLAHFAETFPHITIKYNYDELAEAHIIELSPITEYYNNPKLDDTWITLIKNFWGQFPAEHICFISSDSTLRVENPEFAFNLESNLLIAATD